MKDLFLELSRGPEWYAFLIIGFICVVSGMTGKIFFEALKVTKHRTAGFWLGVVIIGIAFGVFIIGKLYVGPGN